MSSLCLTQKILYCCVNDFVSLDLAIEVII